MPRNRTISSVAIGLLLCLLATPSFGQGPLGFQIFAPADVSTYGGGQQPNEGYFFQFDGLYWSISKPRTSTIGYPGTRKVYYSAAGTTASDPDSGTDFRIERNTLDTSAFQNDFSPGTRIEFGRIEDQNGWFMSIYQLRNQDQTLLAAGGDVVFDDPSFGTNGERLLQGNVNNDATTTPPYSPAVFRDLPVWFKNVLIENTVSTWGVEANYLHRFMTSHAGGTLEMFVGARYFEFDDGFLVKTSVDPNSLNQPAFIGNVTTGTATTINAGVPSFLGGSSWDTTAQNHVVGPQIGLRWFKTQGRWTFSTEGRFMAGLNCQNIEQFVDMGPNLSPGPKTVVTVNPLPAPNGPIYTYNYVYQPFQPKTMSHTTATNVDYAREFSPVVELRLEGRYAVTRAISLHAGWTGMYMDGMARASNMVEYQFPSDTHPTMMGINMDNNRQGVFINGVTFGVDINR